MTTLEFHEHANPSPEPSGAAGLLASYALNDRLTLPNRMVLAPSGLGMADADGVPTEAMAAFYARRADAGLMVTEAAVVRPDGIGFPHAPGIYTEAQVAGWKRVADQVHAAGGRIFLQLWHGGRVSHPEFLDGEQPVAPSPVALSGPVPQHEDLYYGRPRALQSVEIPELVDAFGDAARHAVGAGFDGVEIHGGDGYLIDQFLHHQTNQRHDAYGGSPQRMAHFALDILDAVVDGIGGDRVGIRLSPGGHLHLEGQEDDGAVFRYLLGQMEDMGLAYVHADTSADTRTFPYLRGTVGDFVARHYGGTRIGSGFAGVSDAAEAVRDQRFDLVVLTETLVSDPDLVDRLRRSSRPGDLLVRPE